MSLQDDVNAARKALDRVERTAAQLHRELDALRHRLEPLGARLDAEARGAPGAAAPDIVRIPDTPYDPALWADAEDEGVGRHSP